MRQLGRWIALNDMLYHEQVSVIRIAHRLTFQSPQHLPAASFALWHSNSIHLSCISDLDMDRYCRGGKGDPKGQDAVG